jgi:hypothetical protein
MVASFSFGLAKHSPWSQDTAILSKWENLGYQNTMKSRKRGTDGGYAVRMEI